ncbi:MAG: flagellar biosynthesis protein FlhB [Pantoea sp.]|uniref:Flagellar biosynthetic protein FlhB n=1 Tax=Pantoea septica TaxID=472695 RepID=A0ABX3UVU9_9GAMM|nr:MULTISPECIES: flagellar biosynthesis protein FlhB [Pantoea]MDU5781159.1 flagellar biosynthesis protein FlhB [Pantoea sp.]ORN02594.1 flagellar biosynthesis protein FlhB [Pantoea septica]
MAEESDAEKTEAPTPHRLEKARKEGQIPRSKELTSLLLLLTGWALLSMAGEHMVRQLARLLRQGLSFEHSLLLDPGLLLTRLCTLFLEGVTALLPFSAGLYLVGLTAPMLLGGLLLSGKSIKFDLKRLSPLAGLKRIYSGQLFSELFKSVLKVMLVAMSCTLFLRSNWEHMIQLSAEPSKTAMSDAVTLILKCSLLAAVSILPMAAYDVIYQIFSHIKKLRMTRQEIRDEFKEQEGNPQVKGKIRQIQRAAANRRMMSDVPHADVIVNNPTHYSIAIQYKEGNMAAPVVLAKGTGLIALRIRQIAKEHHLPMLEAPPLARALYRHCEIGEPIPAALYSAVAEVLAWVYGLRRWRASGGLKPKTPANLPVPAALDFNHEIQNDR